MKRLQNVISLLLALVLLGGFALVAPVGAVEEAQAPQWVEKSPMISERLCNGAEVVNGSIYVLGGYRQDEVRLSSVEIYNPKTDRWTSGTAMPSPRNSFGSVVLNGKIYIMGGYNGQNYINSMDIYDPVTDSWESGPSMSVGRAFLSVATVDGKIYAMGGRDAESYKSVVEIYDPETNIWTMGTKLPQGTSHFSSVVWNNKIYVFGGSAQGTISNNVFVYDNQIHIWEEVSALPDRFTAASAEIVGDQIYLLGSEIINNPNGASNKVYIFNLSTNEWHNGPDMMRARCFHASAVVNQTIYAIGGRAGDRTWLNQMEALELAAPDPTPSGKLAVLLNTGETVQLSATDDLADNADFTWTSSSVNVATVDANGRVRAVAPGLSEITATSADGTFNQSIPVRVLPGTADFFRLAVHMQPGQSRRLSMSDQQENVTWRSLNEAIVTVDTSGRVTAVGVGLAIVEASASDTTQQMYVRVKTA